MEVYTIGYQGRSIDEFVALLCNAGVEVLIDVRMNAISRKRGFSKTALRSALHEAGIRYDHRRELGNPTENRRNATSVQDCLRRYRETMADKWAEALTPLSQEYSRNRVALLCFEADHRECHRGVVATVLARDFEAQTAHL